MTQILAVPLLFEQLFFVACFNGETDKKQTAGDMMSISLIAQHGFLFCTHHTFIHMLLKDVLLLHEHIVDVN